MATKPHYLYENICAGNTREATVQALIDGMADDGSQMQANPKDVVSLLFSVLYQIDMVRNLANAANPGYRAPKA